MLMPEFGRSETLLTMIFAQILEQGYRAHDLLQINAEGDGRCGLANYGLHFEYQSKGHGLRRATVVKDIWFT